MKKSFFILVYFAFVFCNSSIAKSSNISEIISIERFLKPHNYYPAYYRIGFSNKTIVDIAVRSKTFIFEDYIKCFKFWAQQIAYYNNKIEFGASFFSIKLSNNQFLLFDYNRNHHFEYISCSGEIIPIKSNKAYQIDYNPSFRRSFFVYFFDLRENQLEYTDDSYMICYYYDPSSNKDKCRPAGLHSPISEFILKNFSYIFFTEKRNILKISEMQNL